MQKVLTGFAALFVLAILVGLALPRQLEVVVSQDVDAYPATVFALVNDFRRIALWAPLTEADPNTRIAYSGPPRGVGATVTWTGAIIGSGKQAITLSEPFTRVETVVNPGNAAESRSDFILEKTDDGTHAEWRFVTDYGYNLIGRYVALVLDDVVRADHEAALQSLVELAESLPATDFSDIDIEHIVVEATTIAYQRTTSPPDPAAMSEAMGAAFFDILNFIDAHGLREVGPPMSILRSFSRAELSFDAAIPVHGVAASTPRRADGVRLGETYEGPVIRVRHLGPYRNLGVTHRKIAAYIAALGIVRAGPAWESYVSDPTKVTEPELLTYVYYPVRSRASVAAGDSVNSI